MTSTPYRTMISSRSRRLRTVGLLLLLAVLGMSVYGLAVQMPSLRRSGAAYRREHAATQQFEAVTGAIGASKSEERAKRVMLLKVTVAYAYWGTCGLLVIALLFVAWLDLREVTRNYLDVRRALWNETAVRTKDDSSPRNGHSEE